ncbi:MAG TPA: oligoendopeptidase F [Chloroflexota bacterium]|nr:oligoendopeptidase F [Chloroflexota bacterium]
MQTLRKRSEMPREFTWDLERVYADESLWEADFQAVRDMVPRMQAFSGRLRESGATLLECLRLRDECHSLMDRVMVFARMRKDEDNSNGRYQALADRAMALGAQTTSATAFIGPELLGLPEDQIQQTIGSEPGLEMYRHYLDELLRQRPHVRSVEVEVLLAQAMEVTRTPDNMYGMLTNADLKFPAVTDSDDNEVELSQSRYNQMRESKDRRVRKDAFQALHGTYRGYRNTLAASLSGSARSDIFYARARNFSTALEAALDPSSIPTEVYHNLTGTINANLGLLHRYVGLRKRLLGLDELHHYDLYVPMVPDVEMEMPFEEGVRVVRSALEPLGKEYGDALANGLASRWIDVYENDDKTSGAYSGGSYTTNPYILLNYQGTLSDVFTLAHEIGHSMHSYFTRRSQPYVYGDYTIFVAEVASTLNESLLTHHLLRQTDDRRLKAYLTNQYLERFRTTLFRQAMFAEFELAIHTRAEQGEALTPDLLSDLYRELNARYYGQQVVPDDEIAIEWARIPHFYWAYYVYQYATGISAAAALSRQILTEGEPAVRRYLDFLRGGSSRYTMELLKVAGVDMATPRPVEQALEVFRRLLDDMETLSVEIGEAG